MNTITNEEALAATAVIYFELKALFKALEPFNDLDDDSLRRKRVINDLKHLLHKGGKVDLTDKSIFNLFDSKP